MGRKVFITTLGTSTYKKVCMSEKKMVLCRKKLDLFN